MRTRCAPNGARKNNRHMRIRTRGLPFILLAVMATPGCWGSQRTNDMPQDTVPTAESPDNGTLNGTPAPSIFDRPMRRMVVQFSVIRVSAPKGTFTEDDAHWRMISTPLPSADTAARIQDNGFRAAIGTESDGEALRRWLEEIEDRRLAVDHLRPNASRLVEIDLGPCEPRQSVWHIDRGGNLHGRLFIDARAKFKLAYEIRSADFEQVWIQLMPEIEEPPGPLTWEITPQGARQIRKQRRHPFRDLVVEAMIPKGGFLLLGPTADVHEQPLLARPFFVQYLAGEDGRQVQTRESAYIIRPTVTASPGGPAALEGQGP